MFGSDRTPDGSDAFDSVLFPLFRAYFYVVGAAFAVSAVFTLDAELRFHALNPNAPGKKFAEFIIGTFTPESMIENLWGWALGPWEAYNKLGFFIIGPLLSGCFRGFSDKYLPSDRAWRQSLTGQLWRLGLMLIFSVVFGLFLTVVVGGWPFFLWLILVVLPGHTFPMDPTAALKWKIWKETLTAMFIAIGSALAAILSSFF
jgi:hypothetical protein